MQINQKKWFKQKERKLNKTGKLDLSCEVLEDLSFIGSRPSMKVLDLSFTSILSFEGLAIQPKLEHLILDGSTISSFKNASSIANITKISLLNTPVSNIPNYKISLLLVCGKNLRIINGKIIPENIKKKVNNYPPIASKLVDRGWIATYPCPDKEELFTLCGEFGIQFDQCSSLISTQKGSLFKSNDINDIINEYSIHHDELIKRSQFMKQPDHYCSMSVTDSNRDYSMKDFQNDYYDYNQLPSLVCDIIKKYGFSVDEGDPVDTITSSLINIFSIAEGNENTEPNDIQETNNDNLDFNASKSEIGGQVFEDNYMHTPLSPNHKNSFEQSNAQQKIYSNQINQNHSENEEEDISKEKYYFIENEEEDNIEEDVFVQNEITTK